MDYLVINDGSTDDTEKLCLQNNVHHVELWQNLGIGGAVQTGYMYAAGHDFDIAVQFDGDGQHDIRCLPQIIQPLLDGCCDLCIGSRFLENSSAFRSTRMRRVGIRFFAHLIRLLTGCKITDPTSGFRAANRAVIEFFAQDYPADYPEPESIVHISRCGFKIGEVPVNMFERRGGTSSISFGKSFYYMLKGSVGILIAALQRRRKK